MPFGVRCDLLRRAESSYSTPYQGQSWPTPEPMPARLVRGCITMAFTATVPADQYSLRVAHTVKGGELSYMALRWRWNPSQPRLQARYYTDATRRASVYNHRVHMVLFILLRYHSSSVGTTRHIAVARRTPGACDSGK